MRSQLIPVAIALSGACAATVPAGAQGAATPRVLRASKATISAISISNDGNWLAAASHDHTVRIWDARTLRLARTLSGHGDEVYDVAFSPDGKRVASSSYDGQLLIWSMETGRVVRSMSVPTWAVTIAYSPDGQRLAASLQNRELRIFNAVSGKLDTTFTANTSSIAFSPDGKRIAWGGFNVAVRNAATGDTIKVFRGHTRSVESIAFSRDGARLVTASRDNTARIWTVATGTVEHVLEPEMPVRFRTARADLRYKLPLRAATFSPDGRVVATVGAGEVIHLWDSATGHLLKELKTESPALTDVEFFPSGRRVAASGVDGGVMIFDVP